MQQVVRGRIVGHLFGFRIPLDSRSGCQRYVGQVCETGGTMAFFEGTQRSLAALHAIEEVSNEVGGGVLADAQVAMLDIALERPLFRFYQLLPGLKLSGLDR